MWLRLLHMLFPGLHKYKRDSVNHLRATGVMRTEFVCIQPLKQAVCRCGDHQPLGTVDVLKDDNE
jgi:hypothetical protein